VGEIDDQCERKTNERAVHDGLVGLMHEEEEEQADLG